jgi:hypothetical protein
VKAIFSLSSIHSIPAVEDIHEIAESLIEAASIRSQVMLLAEVLLLLLLPGYLREALEDPVLRVAHARDAGAVGKAQLRHLAAERGQLQLVGSLLRAASKTNVLSGL